MPEVNKPMTETTSRDLFPGALEMMILESLRRQPSHGYALVQQIQQRSKNLLQVEEGSLYPALQRMLLKGWVTAEWGVTAGNRRARYYQLTTAGRKQLHTEMAQYERVSGAIQKILQRA